jgi:hypothetical protein
MNEALRSYCCYLLSERRHYATLPFNLVILVSRITEVSGAFPSLSNIHGLAVVSKLGQCNRVARDRSAGLRSGAMVSRSILIIHRCLGFYLTLKISGEPSSPYYAEPARKLNARRVDMFRPSCVKLIQMAFFQDQM